MKLFATTAMILVFGVAAFAETMKHSYAEMVAADTKISQSISDQLHSKLSAKDFEGVSVSVFNGKVTLFGRVASDSAKKAAEEVAKKAGGKKVDNRINSYETWSRENPSNGG